MGIISNRVESFLPFVLLHIYIKQPPVLITEQGVDICFSVLYFSFSAEKPSPMASWASDMNMKQAGSSFSTMRFKVVTS